MEIGLSLRHDLQGDAATLRAVARAAESAGVHTLWVPHHTVIPERYSSRYPYQDDDRLPFPSSTIYGDALSVLSHLAACTERVRLGTNVIPMLTQHPVALAKQAATVDHLAGGRLELGLGGGWLVEEAEALGLPADRRGARLDEAIDLMRAAWAGRPFTHAGRFWKLPELTISPAPAQGPDVPVWIGGGSPAALRTVRTRSAGWILPPGPPGRALLHEHGRQLAAAGRPIAIPVALTAAFEAPVVLEDWQSLADEGVSHVVLYTPTEASAAIACIERAARTLLNLDS